MPLEVRLFDCPERSKLVIFTDSPLESFGGCTYFFDSESLRFSESVSVFAIVYRLYPHFESRQVRGLRINKKVVRDEIYREPTSPLLPT